MVVVIRANSYEEALYYIKAVKILMPNIEIMYIGEIV